MKRFIVNFLLFFVSLIAVTITFLVVIREIGDEGINLKLNTNTKYIILGHSHPECAFNDSLIDGTQNLGQSGEAYLYTYLKAKKVLTQNPGVDKVFLTFTNNQLKSSMNQWISGDMNVGNRFSKYSSQFSIEELKILFSNNPESCLKAIPSSVRRNLSYKMSSKNHLAVYGGYKRLTHQLTKEYIDSIMTRIDTTFQPSELNIYYLMKLVSFLKGTGKEVYLIRPPFYRDYLITQDTSFYNNFLHKELSGIPYLDFSDFDLSMDEMADLEHLNSIGAERFSHWFNRFMKLDELNQTKLDSMILIENERRKLSIRTLE